MDVLTILLIIFSLQVYIFAALTLNLSIMKIEFKRRLAHLRAEIDEAILLDDITRGLLPALYSVLSYIWCKTDKSDKRYL